MLKELRIKNLTIIDDLSIEFEKGLNVLTGETGAGKSIIVDAIGLLLGDKASPDMLKTGEKEGMVEAYFDVTENPFLKELSIDHSEGIFLRRTISSQGKSRSYINDTSVSINTLSSVGRSLIAIHGQHEHQSLLKKENHLLFVDLFGVLKENLDSFKAQYDKTQLLAKELAQIKTKIYDREQRVEYLKYQIGEIKSANLILGEKESLEEELNILLNQAKLRELSELAYGFLYGQERACIPMLSQAISKIKEISSIDRSAEELLQMLESVQPILSDSVLFLRKFKERYEAEPSRIESINERLETIKKLEKKYKGTVEDILNYLSSAQKELKELQTLDEETEALQRELNINEKKLLEMASELSEKRQFASQKLENRIIDELKELGFSHADFKVSFSRKALSEDGFDDVEFLFSANPGEPPKPLIKIASGGELSRIMLALKCVEITGKAEYNSGVFPQTLIFDEVDAGIGGITAKNVGEKLRAISTIYQVLSITHLPQIAAMGENHLAVEKKTLKDSTKVLVTKLSDEMRKREIARMLSGEITESSLEHAKELLRMS
ncbi:MAG: DNA repair protein RecN [Thermodesulfovibrio sp.]|nr:DNA repair protein RecN [Thermodesulfovibrio sp.]